jgi:hypothetical protein
MSAETRAVRDSEREDGGGGQHDLDLPAGEDATCCEADHDKHGKTLPDTRA